MTTVDTDNLDKHTILSLTVSTLANVYCERPTPVAKLNRNVLCEEFDDIKHSLQHTRNLHSFILSRCGYKYICDERAQTLFKCQKARSTLPEQCQKEIVFVSNIEIF